MIQELIQRAYRKYDMDYASKFSDYKLARYFKSGFKKIAFRKLEGFEREKAKEMDLRNAEWKNLIIFDGCRHDIFEKVVGDSNFRYSPGSNSAQFIIENLSEGDWSDIVYVTANPHFHESHFKDLTGRNPGEVFHTVFHSYEEKWSHEKSTVLPRDLVDDLKTAKKLFPDKKVIAHFMQPHYPFVNSDIGGGGINPELDNDTTEYSAWQLAERGKYERDEVWSAYRENLEYIIDEVMDELKKLEGKTIITSDHGNLVGEEGFYGHLYKVYAEPLIKVPWYEIGEQN
jgi:hypothetical protein